MKSLDDIKKTPRLQLLKVGADGGWASAYLASSKKNHPAMVVFSNGGGWDHVSVSFSNRCPTWEEMSEVKRMFFLPEEVAVEYHPAGSEYVNMFPYCLHIWRCQNQDIPTPPSWMVGAKEGQSISEVIQNGEAFLNEQQSTAQGLR